MFMAIISVFGVHYLVFSFEEIMHENDSMSQNIKLCRRKKTKIVLPSQFLLKLVFFTYQCVFNKP